jgi:hypothetical protein
MKFRAIPSSVSPVKFPNRAGMAVIRLSWSSRRRSDGTSTGYSGRLEI